MLQLIGLLEIEHLFQVRGALTVGIEQPFTAALFVR